MNLTAIAIVSHAFIGLARREVEATGDLFIKENVAHRLFDFAIKANGKLANVASAFVAIEDLIDSCRVVGCSVNDLTFGKLQLHAVKGDALINRRRIVADHALHAVLHWGTENLAIGNVMATTTNDGLQAF